MTYREMCEECNDDCKKIDINHLIVLCEFGDDYKSFYEDLEKLIETKYYSNLVTLYRTMQGKFSFHARKYKSFIEKHQHTIEIMKKYHCLWNLTVLSYDIEGKRIKNLSEDYFYQYIQKNKENIETIKAVLSKLKELGFESILLDEKLDFTKNEFEMTCPCGDFEFLENIDVKPTYLRNPIKYITTGSHYCMNLKYLGYGNKNEIDTYGRNIKLNSLVFDPSKLPDEITVGTTVEVIQRLADEKKEQYKDLEDSVDLSISTADLENQFEKLLKVIEKIDKVKDSEELRNLLNQMKVLLTTLQSFGNNFEKQVIDSHLSISNKTMENEKRLYLERRNLASIDID